MATATPGACARRSGSDATGSDAQGRAMAAKVATRPPAETLSLWKREQARLKAFVVDRDTEAWQQDPAFSGLQRVGGVDVSFVKGDSVGACASLVVLSYPELEVVYEDCRMVSLTAPYVSGFLAFREVSFMVDAVRRLREKEPHLVPQVLFVDGNGVLHHRGFGVACHLGVLTDLPCIGVAKKLLQVDGLENSTLHKEKIRLLRAGGDSFPLMGGSGTVLGMADIRSRGYIHRTLGIGGTPAPGRERSRKAPRPRAGPEGVSEELAVSCHVVNCPVRSTWRRTEPTCHSPCEGAILEVHPPALVKPSDAHSPGCHLTASSQETLSQSQLAGLLPVPHTLCEIIDLCSRINLYAAKHN
ncbi:endonuclease V isoform X4 [Camelus ferus]|uniref:Endonuclease V isoform X4 n=1 Tax=Camelus ferus TaxID=419612 RepID=A0A8B8R3K0_CAMFR|nr:endonuclease V isoform X4 [Camelus ferus]